MGGPRERCSGGTAAVEARTGEERWSRRLEHDGWPHAGTATGHVVGLDAREQEVNDGSHDRGKRDARAPQA